MQSSETRAQLIRLAARLIGEEGWAAVTARRLAADLGLKRQIVHYYFGTIEDLFIAVIRRSVDKSHERVKQRLNSEEPLRVIYQLNNSVTSTLFEFSAMAMRSKAIRTEMQRYTDAFRQAQVQAITRHLTERGITPTVSPAATAFVFNCVTHAIAIETAIGVSVAHDETRALMEQWLRAFAHSGEWSFCNTKARPPKNCLSTSQQY